MSDTGKKGQNSSSHHPDRERERDTVKKNIYIYVFESERERGTEMDGRDKEDREVETDWQA